MVTRGDRQERMVSTDGRRCWSRWQLTTAFLSSCCSTVFPPVLKTSPPPPSCCCSGALCSACCPLQPAAEEKSVPLARYQSTPGLPNSEQLKWKGTSPSRWQTSPRLQLPPRPDNSLDSPPLLQHLFARNTKWLQTRPQSSLRNVRSIIIDVFVF